MRKVKLDSRASNLLASGHGNRYGLSMAPVAEISCIRN